MVSLSLPLSSTFSFFHIPSMFGLSDESYLYSNSFQANSVKGSSPSMWLTVNFAESDVISLMLTPVINEGSKKSL